MVEFKRGDRVVCIMRYDGADWLVGTEGTVVYELGAFNDIEVGVIWDVYNKSMHNLEGEAEQGHGWWVASNCIEHVIISLENE
ncbi:hypothetical protein [Citrobacter phage CVT22]|uniref:Uncharacterized protein n=1 Tax=Citrobacter phage CVT22 TaxID=1622234 RepID=A0A0R6CRF7_9CAUD|nr:hypothetical protein APL39_gp44 [Citrobacter phage CVT22]AJT60748.1 hypothetical protein [Citrobacter phage CVT22]